MTRNDDPAGVPAVDPAEVPAGNRAAITPPGDPDEQDGQPSPDEQPDEQPKRKATRGK